MNPDKNPVSGDRRSGERGRNYALYFTIAVQILATVWAAATLNATVVQLRDTVKGQGELNATLALAVSDIKVDVAVLKDRQLRKADK